MPPCNRHLVFPFIATERHAAPFLVRAEHCCAAHDRSGWLLSIAAPLMDVFRHNRLATTVVDVNVTDFLNAIAP